MEQKIPKNPISFGLFITKTYKKWAVYSFFFVFLATTLGQLNVVVLQKLTNALIARPLNIDTVWLWVLILPVNFFIAENLWRASGFSGLRWIMNTRSAIYQTLYEYVSLHSKDYFSDRFAGSLTNKISNAVDGIDSLFSQFLWEFFPLILGLILYIIIAWISSSLLGLILLLWSILFILVNMWFAGKLQPRSIRAADALSTLKGRVVDSLNNISLVHEYANVSGEREYIRKYVTHSQDTGSAAWRMSEWLLFTNGILLFIFMFLMLDTSMYLFENKLLTVGVIVMIITMVGNLANQLLFLGQGMRNAVKYYGQVAEGLEEILKKHLIVDSPDALDITLTRGNIIFTSVDFEYESSGVFKNFSLSIPAGQKIGLVGKSGAGKTTFVSLLLRHFDVRSGEITIDGHNIQAITLESLRRGVAFVPQDTSLFHRSIRENISYGSPDATPEQIKKAAIQAQADGFIENLPDKYESLVGERGVKLSGGQRQRIAIARAFLKNAPILVLDEATSSLDTESEQAIQESLETLMQGRTVIAIAHRLSTLKKMNRIVVIELGRIVEDGDPQNLLQKPDSVFKKMWNNQVRGFLVDE